MAVSSKSDSTENNHSKPAKKARAPRPRRPRYLSTTEMVTGIVKQNKQNNHASDNSLLDGLHRMMEQQPPSAGAAIIPSAALLWQYEQQQGIVRRPTKLDVLCGRGKPIQDHAGNQRMRAIVAKHAGCYFQAAKIEKQAVVESVLHEIQQGSSSSSSSSSCGGARFLKRVHRENYWEIVSQELACEKVSHGLRCLVRNYKDKPGAPSSTTENGEKEKVQGILSTAPDESTSSLEDEKAPKSADPEVASSPAPLGVPISRLHVTSTMTQPPERDHLDLRNNKLTATAEADSANSALMQQPQQYSQQPIPLGLFQLSAHSSNATTSAAMPLPASSSLASASQHQQQQQQHLLIDLIARQRLAREVLLLGAATRQQQQQQRQQRQDQQLLQALAMARRLQVEQQQESQLRYLLAAANKNNSYYSSNHKSNTADRSAPSTTSNTK